VCGPRRADLLPRLAPELAPGLVASQGLLTWLPGGAPSTSITAAGCGFNAHSSLHSAFPSRLNHPCCIMPAAAV
jgi:hypothetical protein